MMEMAPGAQEDLYRSVLAQDLLRYRSVVQSLQLAPVARGGRQPAVPLRVFLRAGSRGGWWMSAAAVVLSLALRHLAEGLVVRLA